MPIDKLHRSNYNINMNTTNTIKKHTTLQDIANYCNLSKSMVAKVISDPDNCKATPKTKSLVADAVKKLDYRPNFAAKALSMKRTFTIGVLFPSVNSFYGELGMQIDAALEKRGYSALLAYWDGVKGSHNAFLKAFERMRLRGVDGVITCQYEEAIASAGIPVVTYGNERELMDCVFPDKLDYAVRAVHYLVEQGHRKIGFIGLFADKRFDQINRELKKLELKVNPDWFVNIQTFYQYKDGYDALKKILERDDKPTAVITHGDHVAMGALCAAHELGIRVPGDISLLSYDNLCESAFCVPPLTTFDQQYKLGAELLVETLIKRIEHPELPQQKRSFTMPLVERASVKKSTHSNRGTL